MDTDLVEMADQGGQRSFSGIASMIELQYSSHQSCHPSPHLVSSRECLVGWNDQAIQRNPVALLELGINSCSRFSILAEKVKRLKGVKTP